MKEFHYSPNCLCQSCKLAGNRRYIGGGVYNINDNTMTNKPNNKVEEIAKQIANSIGSPWGEGATYNSIFGDERTKLDLEKESERGGHLDDSDWKELVEDIVYLVSIVGREEERKQGYEQGVRDTEERVEKIIRNVKLVNESNGRYNACEEILQALKNNNH